MIHVSRKVFIILLGVLGFLIGIHPVFADDSPPTLLEVFGKVPTIIDVFISIAAVVFFIMLVIGGYLFMTAVGDPKKIDAAKKSVFFSVIGFALIFLPFIAFPLIGQVAGVKTGFLVAPSNGTISINIGSTFTATPLATNLVNTQSPTPPLGSCPSKPYPSPVQAPATCTQSVSEWDPATSGSYVGKTCAQSSTLEVLNAWGRYFSGINNLFTLPNVIKYFLASGTFGSSGTGYVTPKQWETIADQVTSSAGFSYSWTGTYFTLDQAQNHDTTYVLSMLKQATQNDTVPVVSHLIYPGYTSQYCQYIDGKKVCIPVNHPPVSHVLAVVGYDNNNIYVANPAAPSQVSYTIDYFVHNIDIDYFFALVPNATH